jgi:hypothetical protein
VASRWSSGTPSLPPGGYDAPISPLFGNKQEKAARHAAAEAEANRLAALPVADLAAELIPAFGADGPGRGRRHEVNLLQLSNWLMRSFPGGTKYLRDLERPTREAVQALEHAGLIERLGQHGVGQRFATTRLGEDAIADGSARQRLAG